MIWTNYFKHFKKIRTKHEKKIKDIPDGKYVDEMFVDGLIIL